MANEDVQKGLSQARSPAEDDAHRFRLTGPLRNPLALTAFSLGVCSLIPLIICALDRPSSDAGKLLLYLGMALGPTALIVGILGVIHERRRPNIGALGYAIFGIVLGSLTSLLYWSLFLLVTFVLYYFKNL